MEMTNYRELQKKETALIKAEGEYAIALANLLGITVIGRDPERRKKIQEAIEKCKEKAEFVFNAAIAYDNVIKYGEFANEKGIQIKEENQLQLPELLNEDEQGTI